MIPLLIKSSLVIIILLAFYKLFLEKESFFAANRIYLFSCLLFAATLPFIGLPQLVEHQGWVATLLTPNNSAGSAELEIAIPPVAERSEPRPTQASAKKETAPENALSPEGAHSLTPSGINAIIPAVMDKTASRRIHPEKGATYWLILLYIFGVVVLSLKLLTQFTHLIWKIYTNKDKIVDKGVVVINVTGNIDPCSFFKYIFINPASYDYETYEQIIAHEKIHVRQWHTLDLLLSEVAVVALWFNPFIWLLRREVEKNIEYQTDDLMVRKNAAAKESYQLNLVKIATYAEPLSITTNYNQSLIKDRILKINARRSNPYNSLKYTFLVPTLFGLSLLLNEPARGNDHLPENLNGQSAAFPGSDSAKVNQFSSIQDTLILQTEKHAGYGMFSGGFAPVPLEAVTEDDDRRKRIPVNINELQFGRCYIDFKVWHYERLVESQHAYLSEFLEKWYPEKIDTANLPSIEENTVKVVIGKKNGEQVYIVDQNNNLDFRDDPVRLLKNISSSAREKPARCYYGIYDGEKISHDSSWVYFGLMSSDQVGFSAAQHLRSSFSLDGQEYTVRVFNHAPSARWCFEDARISITAQNGMQKDSLILQDKFELGEFLKFDQAYYQFSDIANDGSTITLIRDKDIKDNFGTQVGLNAPDFNAVTTDGDPITLHEFRGRYLLLTNMDRCRSPKKAYEHYQNIWNNYQSKMEIVGIEYSSREMESKLKHFKPKGKFVISKENPVIMQYYRDFHCSWLCFLIDPGGRIIDRFEIDDWERSLVNHFN